MNTIYFDNAATTKISDDVLTEIDKFLKTQYGNPSSSYSLGRNAKKAIEKARRQVAELLNCNSNELIFTSCGSESDNTAIKGIAYKLKNKGNHIITSCIEHPAVLEACHRLEKEGFEITYLDVDEKGYIRIEDLRKAIKETTILISIMSANNEIGTIQPIEECAKIAKDNNIVFHTDAVQAVGNMNIDVKKMGIDMLSLSGHKIHAPKGIGALYVKQGVDFINLINGGHQEKNKRAGTENVIGIVGLGKACEIAKNNYNFHIKYIQELRDYYIKKLKRMIPTAKLNGGIVNRLPGNANFSFENISGEELVLKLDQKGICTSSGSACSTGSTKPSHVLKAIGLSDKLANSSLRVSFDDTNTKEEIDYLLTNIVKIVEK